MTRSEQLDRRRALAACALALALAPLSLAYAGDASASQRSPVSLRLQQPGSLPIQSTKRFRGFVTFIVPGGWTTRRREAGDMALTLTPITGCSVRASARSLATLGSTGPAAQLRAGLPKASEPGQPEPVSVRTVASGRDRRGLGAWEVIEPPALPGAFTLYAGALIRISRGHWAGLEVGLVAPETCRAAVLRDSRLIASLERLLEGAGLRGARFG
jgi:hypothetical protein